jgi:hypothetical protein
LRNNEDTGGNSFYNATAQQYGKAIFSGEGILAFEMLPT